MNSPFVEHSSTKSFHYTYQVRLEHYLPSSTLTIEDYAIGSAYALLIGDKKRKELSAYSHHQRWPKLF